MQPGDTLAHYEIRTPLGKGGMGEVFLAVDTKLRRDVAVKVLPADFARDADRVARFRREAQVLASLNHANVATIYGLEEDAGRLFLVMELAKGEDLACRVARGPLPVDQVLAVARQVAAGLAEAHAKGIVHRDLKPANLMIDEDGAVKILDFGLARAFAGDGDPEDPPPGSSFSPTVTAAVTQPGVVLGTAAYMSPEQARGRPVDRQADIWAFGCVLFELLTGRRIFAGATVSDSVAAILKSDPPWHELPADTPPALRRLLRRCLEKDKKRRLRDIGDAWLDIEDALADGPEAGMLSSTATRGRGAVLWPAATAILAVAVVLLAVLRPGGGGAPAPAPRLGSLTQLTDLPGEQIQPSLSPDGKTLAYASWDGGDQDIFVQRVGGTNPVNLTANYDGLDAQPAFSPDGGKIAFHSDREGGGIFVMGATGETPLRVLDKGYGPAWSPDGTALACTEEYVTDPYNRNGHADTWIVTLADGAVRTLCTIDAVQPSWSPSGRRIAFCSHLATVQGQRDIYTVAVDGGDPVPVTEDVPADWSPEWSPDGRWIYFISDRGGSPDLWRVAVDEASGRTVGAPEPMTAGMTRVMEVAVSRAGPLALTSGTISGRISTTAFDPAAVAPEGKPRILLSSAHAFDEMSVSLDDSLIAYRTTSPSEDICVMNRDGSDRRRLVADAFRNRGPVISPDDRWVVFYTNRTGNYELWAIRTDGTGLRQITRAQAVDLSDPFWLPDGRLFGQAVRDGKMFYGRIMLPDGGLDALEEVVPVEPVPGLESMGSLSYSKDLRHLIYMDMSRGGRVFAREGEAGRPQPLVIDGRPVFGSYRYGWLDDDRCVTWDDRFRRAVVWNLATGSGRTIPGYAQYSAFCFIDGGHTAVVNESVAASDIWMLTLQP